MNTSSSQFFSDLYTQVSSAIGLYGPRLLFGAIVFLVFYLLALLAKILSKRSVDINLYKRPSKEAIEEYNKTSKKVFYGNLLRIIFLVTGFVLGLLATGIDTVALLSSLGFVGLVLAYSLTDVIKQYYAGFIILTQEPFNIGEQIEIGEVSGVVKNINTRHTIVRDFHEHDVVIPNTQIVDGSVHITPIQEMQRDVFRIHVTYDADVKKAIEVGEQALRNTPGVNLDVAPRGYLRELGLSNMLAFYYTIPGSRREQFNTRNIALQNVLNAFHNAGIQASEPFPPS